MSEPSVKPLGIVIPTYNRCEVLLECLAHLERQSFRDFEVVVIDDGSTDSTARAMESYLAHTPLDIRYARQINSGPARARNVAIEMLRAPICLLIGDDIFPSSVFAERHLRLHREQPELGVAGLGWTQWSDRDQVVTPFMQWLDESPWQFAYRELRAGAKPSWYHFYTSNLSVKTELLHRFRFDERFPYAAMEDLELGYRIDREHGLTIRFIPEAVAYHLHPTSFRQACERMAKVGYSTWLFHELHPEQRQEPPTPLRKFADSVLRAIGRSPMLTRILIGATEFYTNKIARSRRVIESAFVCEYEIGYTSRRDRIGRLVRH